MHPHLNLGDPPVKAEGAETPATPARRLRIMMIENDRADAALALRELRRAGFEVQADVVQAPDEFHRCLVGGSYDAILADHNLPGWTGTDALTQVRQRGLEIPFILVTGSLGEEGAVECIKQGASDYVLKDHLARLPLAVARALKEGELRRARARTEAVLHLTIEALEAAANGILITDRAGAIVWANAACTALTGYSPPELAGHNPSIFKSGRHDGGFFCELWTTILNGGVWHGEIINRRKNGSFYTEETTITPVRDARGAITNFIAIKLDITERKQAEDEIRKLNAGLEQRVAKRTAELASANSKLASEVAERKMAEEALDKLQQQSALILNSAGDGIIRVDLDGRCHFVNPAAAHMLGYAPEEFIGQNLHTLGHHRLPDGAPCSWEECGIYQALTLGAVRQAQGHILQRKDGTTFPVDEVITPVFEKDQAAGAVIIFRDVSERRAMEKMKDEFVSVVSHELRTPLTAIRAALGLLASGERLGRSPRARRLLEIAANNAKRLVRLVNDILDDARLESARVTLAQKVCTAAELTQQVVDLMRPMAESSGVRL
ncbi:MAG TPA: PAS domain S-box protein, partial [Terriglobia bacterium]